jgi:acetylornithine deacetylase
MKGGFAMAVLAIGALRAAMPEAITGELAVLSVIEEECTGNGTLAAGRAGVLGDAVVLPESTGGDLLLGGVGVLWLRITVEGVAAHAESADRAVNPVRNIHGTDEAVELASIVAGARTLARLIAGFFAAGGLPGEGTAQ